MRPRVVDAMQFDGTSAGADQLIAWAREVAPGWPVRPRLEYRGWDDLEGHLEIEVKDLETGCTAGDWILFTSVDEQLSVWLIDEASFDKYYEAV